MTSERLAAYANAKSVVASFFFLGSMDGLREGALFSGSDTMMVGNLLGGYNATR